MNVFFGAVVKLEDTFLWYKFPPFFCQHISHKLQIYLKPMSLKLTEFEIILLNQ